MRWKRPTNGSPKIPVRPGCTLSASSGRCQGRGSNASATTKSAASAAAAPCIDILDRVAGACQAVRHVRLRGKRMECRIFADPSNGASYHELLASAQLAEEFGYRGFLLSDHYMPFAGDGEPGPTDVWTTLAGLARETSRIRLGSLVTSVTFRHPGPLAIVVAQ